MSGPQRTDVLVIGCGVMGAAAAWQLAGDGRRVVLLEQFALGHGHGSSHGGSRIFRFAHPEADLVAWMPPTLGLWQELERETGMAVLTLTGGLFAGPPGDPFLTGAVDALRGLGLPHRLGIAGDPAIAPQLRLPADWQVLLQPQSGILAADDAVATLTRAAVSRGAILHEHTRVTDLTPGGESDGVTVTTDGARGRETWLAGQVVVTAGPWAPRLLDPIRPPTLPTLTPTHQQVAYFPIRDPGLWGRGRAPLWVFTAEPYLYGFPEHERAGIVKVALELLDSAVPADLLGVTHGPQDGPHYPHGPVRVRDGAALTALGAAVERHLVGVDPEPAAVELCLYTETPNRDFVVDRHPAFPQVLLATGFSGRGFKHAVAVGRLLADLAASPPGDYRSRWWLPRLGLRQRVG